MLAFVHSNCGKEGFKWDFPLVLPPRLTWAAVKLVMFAHDIRLFQPERFKQPGGGSVL